MTTNRAGAEIATGEIAELLGVSPQQVRNLGRTHGWEKVRTGRTGPGAGNLYRVSDVVAELRRRADDKVSQAEELRRRALDLEKRIDSCSK